MSPFFQPMKAVKATKPSAIRSTLVIRSGGYSRPRIPGAPRVQSETLTGQGCEVNWRPLGA